jgi:hypothetical protein
MERKTRKVKNKMTRIELDALAEKRKKLYGEDKSWHKNYDTYSDYNKARDKLDIEWYDLLKNETSNPDFANPAATDILNRIKADKISDADLLEIIKGISELDETYDAVILAKALKDKDLNLLHKACTSKIIKPYFKAIIEEKKISIYCSPYLVEAK